MFEVLKKLIESGTRTLRDLEGRIAYCVSNGGITPEEAAELTTLAESQAAPPDVSENTEMAVRLGAVEGALAMLKGRLDALEKTKGEVEGGDESEAPTEPQPPPGVTPWKPNTAYKYGDTVWHNSAVWLSKVGNNRIEPGAQAYAWDRMS